MSTTLRDIRCPHCGNLGEWIIGCRAPYAYEWMKFDLNTGAHPPCTRSPALREHNHELHCHACDWPEPYQTRKIREAMNFQVPVTGLIPCPGETPHQMMKDLWSEYCRRKSKIEQAENPRHAVRALPLRHLPTERHKAERKR